MELTKKQEEGLRVSIERFKNKEKYTCIAGYAGTGKSTLVRFIVAALDIDESDICYATFTGKAAQVLLKKGNKNVSTLHKLLYKHIPLADGSFFRQEVDEIPYDIVIVDEVSMAPLSLMNQLFKYPVHVICLGDPFQLPPVDENENNHLLDKPHVFLDEVMRQAKESEIIQLTMAIRNNRPIGWYQGKEVLVLPKTSAEPWMYSWADQVLVGTNDMRDSVNQAMRAQLGRGDHPEEGDKVICLRNYWDEIADNGDPLVNGTIGTISNTFQDFIWLPQWLSGKKLNITKGVFTSDSNANFNNLDMDTEMILTGKKCVDKKLAFRIGKSKKYQNAVPLEFTYGYAITCHKSQGSEWDKVLVLEEKFPFPREEHARWLYTACTRASERLILLK